MNRLIDVVVGTTSPLTGGRFSVQFCREGRGTRSYYPTSQHIVSRVIRAVNSERARGRVKINLYAWGWSAWRVTEEEVRRPSSLLQGLVEAIGRHPAAEADPEVADAVNAVEDALKESQHE